MIDLRCGDCYQVIKDISDKSIDLVVIDPPYQFCAGGNSKSELGQRKYKQKKDIYGLDTDITKRNIGTGYVHGGGCFGTKNRNYHSEINQTDQNADADKQSYFISKGIDNSILEELCRVMKKINIYIWCSKDQLRQLFDFFGDKGCFIDLLAWHKTNPIPTCNNTYLSDTEYLVFAKEGGVRVYGTYETKHKYWVSEINVEDKKTWDHPTIKPLHIIKNLIINSSKENDLVLDCFMGSGTTGVACKELNRDFIGIELNQKYFTIAESRINQKMIKNEEEITLF